jgi:hypothetical protein
MGVQLGLNDKYFKFTLKLHATGLHNIRLAVDVMCISKIIVKILGSNSS